MSETSVDRTPRHSILGINTPLGRFARKRYKWLVKRRKRQADSLLEQKLRKAYVRARYKITGDFTARDWTVFRRGPSDKVVGIYALGSCDLPSIFAAKPLIASRLDGTCCITYNGGIADARSDFLLQGVDRPKDDGIRQAIHRLRLAPEAFEPRLFRPTFAVPDMPHLGDVPKTVTVLSIGADLSRTLYRHKEHGYLVDPGGYWLKQDLNNVAADPRKVEWVKDSFNSLGVLSLDQFRTLFGRVLSLLGETGTTVVVYNMAVIRPGDLTFNYRYRRNPPAIRRMEFNDALADLATVHDVSILNVDRILKGEGIQEQVDFSHFPLERMMPIAAEFVRILREREVI